MKDYGLYSLEQRSRDIAVYSKGAERRIEKAILSGGSISGARSLEADRIAKYRSMSKFVRNKKLAIVGAIIGSQTARPLLTYAKERLNNDIYTDTPINRIVGDNKSKINDGLDFVIDTPYLAESVGAAVGGVLIPKLLSSVVMMAGGYSPSKSL